MAEALAQPRESTAEAGAIRADEVLVLDFGGQYSQLIARRVRECGVFSELLPHTVPLEEIRRREPRGLILSGGPASVYADGAPKLRRGVLGLRLPGVGLCYGLPGGGVGGRGGGGGGGGGGVWGVAARGG